jgi:hypothetical protein
MFDCPLQSQTSPTRILVRTILFPPEMVRMRGPPALSGRRRGNRLPGELDGDAFARVGCAPDGCLDALLQNCIVGEKRVGDDIGVHSRIHACQRQQQQDDLFHLR